MENFKCLKTFCDQDNYIFALCIYKNYLFYALDKSIKVLDLDNFEEENNECIISAHDDFITNLLIYKDYLISRSFDKTIKIWDLRDIMTRGTFESIKKITDQDFIIKELFVYHDNLFSISRNGKITIWNLNNFKEEPINFIKKSIGDSNSICIYKDYLISGSWDKTIKIWNISNFQENFECIETLRGHTDWISCLCIWSGPGQDYLISGSYDKTIKIWKLNISQGTSECLQTLIAFDSIALTEDDSSISSLCIWTISSQDYLISGSSYNTIKIWDLSMVQDQVKCIKNLAEDFNFYGNIFALSTWSGPGQDYLISGGRCDQTIKIWGDSILYHFKNEDSKLQSIYSDISKDTELRLTETCLRCFLLEESILYI